MAHKGEPIHVSEVLEAALGPARYRQVKQQLSLAAAWEEIAGPLLFRHVRPVALLGGVLWLEADSPPFAQEAQLRSAQLSEAVNRLLGAEVVGEVRLGKSRPAPKSRPRKRS
jgi:hypothetical protein